MIYLKLFLSFLQIGLFSFGGGYASLRLIQEQVVTQNNWLSLSEFTDLITISQMTPGPVGINSATRAYRCKFRHIRGYKGGGYRRSRLRHSGLYPAQLYHSYNTCKTLFQIQKSERNERCALHTSPRRGFNDSGGGCFRSCFRFLGRRQYQP